jgi:hypothetical protein
MIMTSNGMIIFYGFDCLSVRRTLMAIFNAGNVEIKPVVKYIEFCKVSGDVEISAPMIE